MGEASQVQVTCFLTCSISTDMSPKPLKHDLSERQDYGKLMNHDLSDIPEISSLLLDITETRLPCQLFLLSPCEIEVEKDNLE